MKKAVRYILGSLAGAVVGFLYYRFIGCQSGTCPITSSPYISTVFGAVFGFLITNIIVQ